MRFKIFCAALCLTLSTALLQAGGWAAITVHHLPDAIVAGVPTNVVFTIRAHGVHLLTRLPATAEAIYGNERITAPVRTGSAKYAASFILPHPGEWTLVIHSGYGTNPNNAAWIPITVVSPGQTTPSHSAPQQGARLFVAKGCMTCHRHAAIDTRSTQVNVGGMLSGKTLSPEHIRQTLRNPPERNGDNYTWMPNLGLSEAEIAALTAFLTETPRSTRR